MGTRNSTITKAQIARTLNGLRVSLYSVDSWRNAESWKARLQELNSNVQNINDALFATAGTDEEMEVDID